VPWTDAVEEARRRESAILLAPARLLAQTRSKGVLASLGLGSLGAQSSSGAGGAGNGDEDPIAALRRALKTELPCPAGILFDYGGPSAIHRVLVP
jgi:hypothetical protein